MVYYGRDHDGIFLEDRDPEHINSHIKIFYEEIIAEPEEVTSLDCVWTHSYKCFHCGKALCYNILTALCSIFIAVIWGCSFAETAFVHVWCYVPCLRFFAIWMGLCQKCAGTCTRLCLGTVFESSGQLFSHIIITRR